VNRTGARKDESTHAKFFCNLVQNYQCKPVARVTINLFLNLSMAAVLSIFWLLYKQVMDVSTRVPEAKGTWYRSLYPQQNFSQKPCSLGHLS